MKRHIFMAVVACALLTGCTDPETAKRAAEDMGMTNVQASGYSLFGCTKEYFYSTKFTATNSHGHKVSGVVCSGWFKGATVHLF